jgi:FeS assembly SUF system protein
MSDKKPTSAPETAAPEATVGAKTSSYAEIKEQVLDVLRNTFDPEIPVNIYELGLIYDLVVEPSGEVTITMTLTSPMCPVAESLPPEVEAKVAAVPGVGKVNVNLVWEPPWDPSKMSADAKLLLNIP